jgi:hypothetical protein
MRKEWAGLGSGRPAIRKDRRLREPLDRDAVTLVASDDPNVLLIFPKKESDVPLPSFLSSTEDNEATSLRIEQRLSIVGPASSESRTRHREASLKETEVYESGAPWRLVPMLPGRQSSGLNVFYDSKIVHTSGDFLLPELRVSKHKPRRITTSRGVSFRPVTLKEFSDPRRYGNLKKRGNESRH